MEHKISKVARLAAGMSSDFDLSTYLRKRSQHSDRRWMSRV